MGSKFLCTPLTVDRDVGPRTWGSSLDIFIGHSSRLEKGGPAGTTLILERLRKPRLQELAELGCRLKLWDRIQLFECRSERIGKTPDRSRLEFLVLRL